MFNVIFVRGIVGFVTVTLHVAVLLPTFAVIVAVPAPTAVTFPPDTVATLGFDVVHVTVLLSVVFDGVYATVNVLVPPFVNDNAVLFNVIFARGIFTGSGAVTVTLNVAFNEELSTAVAVIVAVPAFFALYLIELYDAPYISNMSVFEHVNLISGTAVPSGVDVTAIPPVSPTSKVSDSSINFSPVGKETSKLM